MRVTIKEVAKLAGVSPSTVSRVLTDHPKISQATKDRVWKAMKKLDYHPNVTARKLATNATKTIGLLLPNDVKLLAENPFFIQVLTGVTTYAQSKGYYIMLTNAETREGEVEALNHLFRSNLIDGVIMTVVREEDPCIEFLRENNHPYAVIGRPNDTDSTLWVDNDNFQAMYEMVNYLIKEGNQKIAFIGGSKELTVTKNRRAGYEMALKNRGLHLDENMVKGVKFSEAGGYEATKDLLEENDVDAIATTDDLIAVGALKALKDLNKEGITVTGFNNTPIGNYQTPPLLTVEINAVELGHYSAKLLIDKLNNLESAMNSYIVDTKLIKES
ncbi:LacI family transcriptional regulator [Acidaminobacter sp. JC074]|uniref:LacI family DNA-binding transcriptional regulator n=1 Tax=Acidaminobacter sp. JC074 TaxID=2530199 RepID=UPI001F0E577B|nr:LacI family DNA-binding transcriptional regulator [Acidaminobacter sp. JC074]MCH4888283.1 LacI family transcriptional regulator [Acidaminobacter sp. JC074]